MRASFQRKMSALDSDVNNGYQLIEGLAVVLGLP
jgi:hypothetical protein